MEIVRKIVDGEKETTILHHWDQPDADVKVSISGRGEGGNASCHFELEITDGQVDFKSKVNGGSLQIDGEWERECFIELLKQIVIEMELIDKQ